MPRRKQINPQFIKDELTEQRHPVELESSPVSQELDRFRSVSYNERKVDLHFSDSPDSASSTSPRLEESELYRDFDEDDQDKENDLDVRVESSLSDATDLFSSPPSSNYSASLSDGGIATPISSINESIKSDEPTHLVDERKLKYLKGLSSSSSSSAIAAADGTYSCQFCSKTFPRLGYLKKHEQSHAEHMPFRCEYCARLFKHKRSRDRHTKLHTGDRRYKCPHCEAAFSRSDHLKIHMKTHDNRKPFQCTICNRGYNTAAALTSHMQNHKKQQQHQQHQGLSQPGLATTPHHHHHAHLMGATRTPNYSPRSNNSTPKSGKRKYASAFLDKDSPTGPSNGHLEMRNRIALDGLGTPSPNSLLMNALPPNRVCVYCTKSDFQSNEQLFNHIQTKHYGLLFPASSYNPMAFGGGGPDYRLKYSLDAMGGASSMEAKTFDCHICPEARYPSVQLLYQHLRTFHINQSAGQSHTDSPNRMSEDQEDEERREKRRKQEDDDEEKDMNNNDGLKETIKSEKSFSDEDEAEDDLEDQSSPTDLSKPKMDQESPQSQQRKLAQTPVGDAKNFLCNQCNAGFEDFESFRKHLKSHIIAPPTPPAAPANVDVYSCKKCSLDFSTKHSLEEHQISHFLVEDVEYNCSVPKCCKSTKPEEMRKHYMEQHMHVVFRCSICEEIFENKVSLELHFSVSHRFEESKIFRCSTCIEVFHSLDEFRHHVTTRHLGRTGVQCLFCPVSCDSELEMHFHLSTHSKQFQCPVCPEAFHVEFLLDRHMQTHQMGSKGDVGVRPELNAQYLFEKQGLLQKRAMLIPPGSPLNQFPMKQQPGYPPHLLNQLYMSTAMAREHPLFWARNDLRQRMALTSPRMDFFHNSNNHQAPPQHHQQKHIQEQDHKLQQNHGKENGQEAYPGVNNEGSFQGESAEATSDSEGNHQRKAGHSIKTGVSLRCAYCNGDFRSRTELENHMKSSHNTSGKHKCLICDDISPSATLLAEHKLTHCKIGQSSECCYCQESLLDSVAFKGHLREHNNADFPIQCICCRQTLNSEFEIGLHAKFHMKEPETTKQTCALCLGDLPDDSPNPKVCAQCTERHNIRQGLNQLMGRSEEHPTDSSPRRSNSFGGDEEDGESKKLIKQERVESDDEEEGGKARYREDEEEADERGDDINDEENVSVDDCEAQMNDNGAAPENGVRVGDVEEDDGHGHSEVRDRRDSIVNVESEIKVLLCCCCCVPQCHYMGASVAPQYSSLLSSPPTGINQSRGYSRKRVNFSYIRSVLC